MAGSARSPARVFTWSEKPAGRVARDDIHQRQLFDRLAVQRAVDDQPLDQLAADHAGRAGDENVHARSLCARIRAELRLLPPIPIEILRREPALERGLARGPLAVEHGEIGGVAVAALGDHVLAQDAFEHEAVAQRRAARRRVERVAFPFVAAVAERLEHVARQQILRLGARAACAAGPANRRCGRPRPRASPGGFPSAWRCRRRGRTARPRRRNKRSSSGSAAADPGGEGARNRQTARRTTYRSRCRSWSLHGLPERLVVVLRAAARPGRSGLRA